MKVEITENEFKKVMVLIKGTKPFLRVLFSLISKDWKLYNTWRVADKMADTMLRRAGYHVETSSTGKVIVKKND